MKKKVLLLPLLLFALTGCNPSLVDSSDDTPSSDTPELTVVSISAEYPSETSTYKVGDTFNIAGLVVTAHYSDDTTKTISNYSTSISNNYVFTSQDVGTFEVIVTYGLDESIYTSFNLVIVQSLSKIEIDYDNVERIYTVGNHFNPTGLEVYAVYSDESRQLVTNYTLNKDSSYVFTDEDTESDVEIVVTYEDKTASFFVHVNPDTSTDTLLSIEVTTLPHKVSYAVGEIFDLSGLVITATYQDAGEVLVDKDFESSIANGYLFKSEDVGVLNSVTITYESLTDDFAILVYENTETIEDKCNEMNALLPSSIKNPFEARDYLLEHGYSYLTEAQDNNEFFGYDYEDNAVVIYSMTQSNSRSARYPSSSSSHEIVSYQTREVTTSSELFDAVTNVGIGVGNYSTIVIGSDIVVDNTIVITSSEPFEFDFDNRTVTSSVAKDVFRANGDDVVINFKGNGGGIETITDNTKKDIGDQTAPACISALNYKSIDIDNVKLKCNARYGYALVDSLYASKDSTITMDDCNNVYAVTNAICIVGSTFVVKNSTINGVVNISGGNVTIDSTLITAIARHDDATGLVLDPAVREIALYLYEDNYSRYGYYSVSAPDPVIVFDRRGLYDTYDNPIVTIKDSTLIADYENETVYGYGIRYIDLNLGTKTTFATINLEGDVTFYSCKTPDAPQGAPGGYNVALPH